MLPQYNIPVSFFLIGQNLNAFPCLMNQEYHLGFSTLSHTFTHPDLTTLTAAQVSAADAVPTSVRQYQRRGDRCGCHGGTGRLRLSASCSRAPHYYEHSSTSHGSII